jgi:hypothetical protein
VDRGKGQAIGSARREAIILSRTANCRVSIQERKGRRWTEIDHVNPPADPMT